MTVGASDILLVLSGGTGNTDPLNSLGGEPSPTIVNSALFNDIEDSQTTAGYTDYRCIYVTNNNASDGFYDVEVYTADEVEGGVSISLGFIFQNEIQQVSISTGTSVTSGSFTLQHEEDSFVVNYNSDLDTWAANFQTAIRAITGLGGVNVSGGISGTTVIFTVEFDGVAGYRYHPILEVVDDSGLSPIGGGHVTAVKLFDGSPINSIAPEIDIVTTTPNEISFATYSSDAPATIGDLNALDYLPVWIRRICSSSQPALANDGFSLKISGNPF